MTEWLLCEEGSNAWAKSDERRVLWWQGGEGLLGLLAVKGPVLPIVANQDALIEGPGFGVSVLCG